VLQVERVTAGVILSFRLG